MSAEFMLKFFLIMTVAFAVGSFLGNKFFEYRSKRKDHGAND
jgi:hypothetical protein